MLRFIFESLSLRAIYILQWTHTMCVDRKNRILVRFIILGDSSSQALHVVKGEHKVFSHYKHLLQENYLEYKHMQL